MYQKRALTSWIAADLVSLALFFLTVLGLSLPALAQQSIVSGPADSVSFASQVLSLPNGNFVVTDPDYQIAGTSRRIGAVYLYRANGTQISRLVGVEDGDNVGKEPIIELQDSNFLIRSPYWGSQDQGALTWCSGALGCDGAVSASNSLVGASAGDRVGENITLLKNGNYVAFTPNWDEGAIPDVGAVTWGSAQAGTAGLISESNSLLGSRASDKAGAFGVVPLNNGNYVIRSAYWRAPVPQLKLGALTLGSGTSPILGRITAANSFIGSAAASFATIGVFAPEIIELEGGSFLIADSGWNDGPFAAVGAVTYIAAGDSLMGSANVFNSLTGTNSNDRVGEVIALLKNGQYAIGSPKWRGERGAVTLSAGANRLTGRVSATNSLVGSNLGDQIGWALTPLQNGNLVVSNPFWGGRFGAWLGSVTFLSATSPTIGQVTTNNSLYSVETSFFPASFDITPLVNGNFVVSCPICTINGFSDAGAAIFSSGVTGITGPISTSNSLHGSQTADLVGRTILPLSTGNYLVLSPQASHGLIDSAGAASFGNGQTGITGAISPTNSLVGSAAMDQVGEYATVLRDGSYVVISPLWANGGKKSVGAATFGSANAGVSGQISAQNSLVGGTAMDQVAGNGVKELSQGRVVVTSSSWSNASATAAGAITVANAADGLRGIVSTSNSLVGSRTNDRLGNGATSILQLGASASADDNILVFSPQYQSVGAFTGAASIIQSKAGQANQTGVLTAQNSVFGTVFAGAYAELSIDYHSPQALLLVGQPRQNRVTLFHADALFKNGFEP